MNKPIISIWGIGPAYRNRVKYNIREAINSGYNGILDYTILTDLPEDFDDLLKETDKIKAVIDIHQARAEYPWSIDTEFIPSPTKDEIQYGKEYAEGVAKDTLFSYSLHRFSFPTISKLGYNKVIFCDCDVKINYDKIVNGEMSEEEFWAEFDTPINSMKGCYYEKIHSSYSPHNENEFVFNISWATGYSTSIYATSTSSIHLYKLKEKYNKEINCLLSEVEITEGPFRFYNFESPSKLLEYFKVWNDTVEISLTDKDLRTFNRCGGYNMCDYFIVSVCNIFNGIKVLNFPEKVYSLRIFFEDRYSVPPYTAPGSGGIPFIPGESIEDFYNKNTELKNKLEKDNMWPYVNMGVKD